MKLYNVIVIWDVYSVAHDGQHAVEAVRQFIANGDLPPSEYKAMEAREERNIRQSWRDQKPLVGADISNDDFAKVQGRTTAQIFEHLYLKR